MAVIGTLVVGALVLAGYPSLHVVSVARNTQPETFTQPVHVPAAVLPEAKPAPLAASVAAVAPTRVPKAIVEKPKQTAVITKKSSPADSIPSPPAAAAASGAGPAIPETVAIERTKNPSAGASAAVASTATPDGVTQPVTISGCLETTVDEDQYRLTDTAGADAPKARSWRSGFLKKRSAPVELVELSDTAALRKYVGRRVMATGLLTGLELRVRSLHPAGASCN